MTAAGRGLRDYFARVIDARRGRAGADLISMLVEAEEAGDRLSTHEIVSTCNLLVVKLPATSTPDQLAKLCAHPELVTNGGRGDAALRPASGPRN